MKKYLLLGLVIVIAGVLGARVWLANSADEQNERISPQQLAGWVQNPDNAVSEVHDDYFYIQEAIGSTGIILQYPQTIRGDFELHFQLMSLTKAAEIRFSLSKDRDIYDIEMKLHAKAAKIRLLKNKLPVLEKDGIIIRPDVYYSFSFDKESGRLSLEINDQPLLHMEIGTAPLRFAWELTGEPDRPAAIEIRDMTIIHKSK